MRALVPSLLALSFLVAGPTPATAAGGRTPPAIAKPAPKITRLAKPVALKLESIAALGQPQDQPEYKPQVLTAEQIAVDTITLDGATLGTPQIGMNLWGGTVHGIPTAGFRGLHLSSIGQLEIFVQLPWVGTHLLQVDCKGVNIQAMKVRYGRWSTGGFAAEGIGSMIIDQAGESSLSFSIPGENHAPAEYLAIVINDADGTTLGSVFQQCTFKRF